VPEDCLLTVQGEILFDKPITFSPCSVIYIRLEDVTQVDSFSTIITEKAIKGLTAGNKIGFDIEGMICNTHNYIISVHADIDGDGKISVGDFINMQSYPVLTYGHPKYISVDAKQVN
jgi:uncharacterized lipoprotein YbaY